MTSPLKPWEMDKNLDVNMRSADVCQSLPPLHNPTTNNFIPTAIPTQPLPANLDIPSQYYVRNDAAYSPYQQSFNQYNPYGGSYLNSYPYGRFGNSYGYGAGAGYGLGGGFGYNNYNNYGNVGSGDSVFRRLAESSARPTFQAIESITRAMNSIAFMMESTLGSVGMSFHAMLAVVDNFSHAKDFLKKFCTTLLALKFVGKLYSFIIRTLRMLRVISPDTCANSLALLTLSTSTEVASEATKTSSLPFLGFIALMIAAPYLISKMVSTEGNIGGSIMWNPGMDGYISVVAISAHEAKHDKELNVKMNEKLKMIPPAVYKPQTDYYVFVANEEGKRGFVPRHNVALASPNH